MFIPLIAAALVQGSGVTFESAAKPLSRLLPELSRVAGQNLRAVSSLADEPIILYCKDAPLQDVLAKISQVVLGKWKRTETGYELQPDPGKLRVAQELERNQRIAGIQTILTRWAALVSAPLTRDRAEKYMKAVTSDDPKADPGEAEGIDPLARFERKLACAVGAEAFASVGPAGKLLYSSSNEKNALPLTPEMLEAWKLYREEYKLMEEVGKQQGMDDKFPIAAPQGKPFLEVTVSNTERQGLALFVVAAEDGGRSAGELSLSNEDEMFNKNMPHVPANPHRLIFSPETLALQRLGTKPAVGSAFRQQLLHPEKFEPLDYSISEALLQEAKLSGRNLVAAPEDDWSYAGEGITGTWVETYLAMLQKTSAAHIEKDGQWTVVTSSAPVSTISSRFKRSDLADLLALLEEDRFGHIEDIAAFAARNPASVRSSAPSEVIMFLYREWVAGPDSRYCAYGMLTTPQREALAAGKALHYNDLTSEQRSYFMSLEGDSDEGIEGDQKAVDLDANGVPSDLVISMTEKKWLVGVDVSSGVADISITPASYAEEQLSTSSGVLMPRSSGVNGYIPAWQRVLTFLIVAGGRTKEFKLEELKGRDGKPVALKHFPEEFAAQVKLEKKRLEEGTKSGGGQS